MFQNLLVFSYRSWYKIYHIVFQKKSCAFRHLGYSHLLQRHNRGKIILDLERVFLITSQIFLLLSGLNQRKNFLSISLY